MKIQNINNEASLDLHLKNLFATNLYLVGLIQISEANCYVHRLEIMGSGTGVVLMKRGAFCATFLNALS